MRLVRKDRSSVRVAPSGCPPTRRSRAPALGRQKHGHAEELDPSGSSGRGEGKRTLNGIGRSAARLDATETQTPHLTMLDSTDQRFQIDRPVRLRELSPMELRCLDIDVGLRDVWALLDQLPGRWKKRQLQFFAGALRVSYERGLTAGKLAGFEKGFEEGHEQGYAEGTEVAHEAEAY